MELVLVGDFNQEKALVGAFSVIVKTDGAFATLPLVLVSVFTMSSPRPLT